MMAVWRIALMYLYRIIQRPVTILFLMAVPFTLAAIEYAVFGPARPTLPASPTQIALVDADVSTLSAGLVKCLKGALDPDEVRIEQFPSVVDAKRAVGIGDYGALILIPRSFGADIRRGESSTVQLQSGADTGAAVAENLLETCTNLQMLALAHALPASDALYISARLSNVSVEHTASEVRSEATSSSTFFAEVLPGLAIFGVLFLSQTMAGVLWRDRHSVSQLRLWCAPIGGWAITLGGLLYMALGIFVILTTMGLAARVVLGVEFHRVPLLVLDVVGFSFCAAGAQILLGSMTKSEQSAKGISSVAIMLLSLLGGAFVPLDRYPAALLWLARAVPNGAALSAAGAILNTRENMEIAFPLLMVWVWAFVLGAAALLAGNRRMNA